MLARSCTAPENPLNHTTAFCTYYCQFRLSRSRSWPRFWLRFKGTSRGSRPLSSVPASRLWLIAP